MFQHKPRRFRSRTNGRSGYSRHGDNQTRLRPNNFSNGQMRNNFRGATQSAEKLFEKYNTLAKEALSSGDKTLSENYFQHAEHFMRMIEDKNKNQTQTQNKLQLTEKIPTEDKNLSQTNNIEQEKVIKEK